MLARRSRTDDALRAAGRCLEAARAEQDLETRRALERAAVKYLQRVYGKDFIGRQPAAQPQPVDAGAGARKAFASRLFQ